MPLISDNFHLKKLENNGINIKTKYIVGTSILERNTNNSYNDNIVNGIRCEKQYFLNDKMVYIEKEFDTRIEYSFIYNENDEYTCPNCGMHSILKSFVEGCPYCGTYYNIDYVDKDLGIKYHYDRVLKNKIYRVITGIIDLFFSIFLSYFFIKSTSRTFNSYDISKVFIYGLVFSFVLYYFFYIVDAYIVLGPIKKYKDRQNKRQMEFWDESKIDKKGFFNNLNYEVRKYYYSNCNIIDFDVIDYISFKSYKKNNDLFIDVKANVRIVYFDKNKIYSKNSIEIYTLKKYDRELFKLNPGVNIIQCINCGASIDINAGMCSHCNTKINYFQEWILVRK